MSIVIVLLCIGILVLLITHFKVNAFLAFLIISVLAGLWLGIDASQITGSIQKGIGDMLGSLVIVIVAGAMLGKLIETYCGGSTEVFVCRLIRREKFTEEQLLKLKRLAQDESTLIRKKKEPES